MLKQLMIKLFGSASLSAVFLFLIAHLPLILATIGSILWIGAHYWKYIKDRNEAKISAIELKKAQDENKS